MVTWLKKNALKLYKLPFVTGSFALSTLFLLELLVTERAKFLLKKFSFLVRRLF
jgi:hypothetical protein